MVNFQFPDINKLFSGKKKPPGMKCQQLVKISLGFGRGQTGYDDQQSIFAHPSCGAQRGYKPNPHQWGRVPHKSRRVSIPALY